ncbi:ATP-binding protein [Sporosarcina highlanderae]|uniref:AAA family ATPase n=1 Tax=Sporosarcina highlanderae TaxID=3035916 RepID=A0ABT8JU41_9BACL|nr:AAA family ATPase [Sporosarcina highlanderae]MDN4608584.1 AAA family ATPase [Sporosarcina highlanderae]
MKIKKIVIYGFGKHENKTIDFVDGVNVMYGQNEAGKTTIQQFIIQTLFGFPQKNSSQLRYEPKSGGIYGGQVHVQDDVHGECIIERVRGKSSGDVTVIFEDGTQGGEEALHEILRQYDRASFESVFSFSLLQLQGFERMDEIELSRTLLASGTTGIDSLLSVEKKMEKEIGDLFKKTGRNPEMNVRLQELKDLETDLKKEQERVSAYSPKVKRIREIEREWMDTKNAYDRVREQNQSFGLQLQLLPLYERKQTLLTKLDRMKHVVFPADGIRRFETVQSKLTEMEAKMRGLTAEIEELNKRLQDRPDNQKLQTIERLLSREIEWHKWRTEIGAIRERLGHLKAKRLQVLDRLGLDNDNLILQADVSIHQEESLYEQLQTIAELDRQQGYIDRQLTQLENALGEVRKDQLALQKNPLSEEELKRVDEWPSIERRLAEAKAYLQFRQTTSASGNSLLLLVIAILSIMAVGFGLVDKQWLFVVIGVCLAVVAALLGFANKKDPVDTKLNEMKKFVAAYSGYENEMKGLTEKIAAYRQKESQLSEAARNYERQMSGMETEFESLSQKIENLEVELSGFFITYGMHKIPNSGILHEFFGMARSLQEIKRESQELNDRRNLLEGQLQERREEIVSIIGLDAPEDTFYEKVRSDFIQEKSAIQSFTTHSERLETILTERNELGLLIQSLQEQRDLLFKEATVNTEEHYYQAYTDFEEKCRLMQQLGDTDSQLAMHEIQGDQIDLSEEELRVKISEAEKEMSDLEYRLDQLVQEKSTLKIETEKLLTDDAYQQKQQFFELKKAEFMELGKKWAVRQTIVAAIKSTMNNLKDKKLPNVLLGAESIFRELTGDKYVSLGILENGLFQAVSKDGVRYPIIELSQATKEQAYISLRLSLAMEMEKTAPFPIIMDDPFVHFDEIRLSRMKKIIEQLGLKHQFIYFTCHDKIVEEWTNAKIITVSTSGSAKGAIAR